jgi:hypothetical protein
VATQGEWRRESDPRRRYPVEDTFSLVEQETGRTLGRHESQEKTRKARPVVSESRHATQRTFEMRQKTWPVQLRSGATRLWW